MGGEGGGGGEHGSRGRLKKKEGRKDIEAEGKEMMTGRPILQTGGIRVAYRWERRRKAGREGRRDLEYRTRQKHVKGGTQKPTT